MTKSDSKLDECEALLESQDSDLCNRSKYETSAWLSFVRNWYLVAIALAFVFGTVLLSSSKAYLTVALHRWHNIQPIKVPFPHVYKGITALNPVNTTLGFQKIMALNLPQRMDKKDELTLMAYATNINIGFLTTRTMDGLDPKGLPYHAAFPSMAILAAWRAHADAWEHVVSNRISTALILEDDSDWDINLKRQVQRLQQPFATLLQAEANDTVPRIPTREDPWMHQDWDMIYFGYCLEDPFTQERHPPDVNITRPPHVLYDDDTVADRKDGDQSIAFTPVAVLLISFAFKLKEPSSILMAIVGLISVGVATASYGEVGFEFFGFLAQVLAILFKSCRLVMIQVLLQSLKMDPLVSLYHFAHVCAGFNTILLLGMEGSKPFEEMGKLGAAVLLTNASVAFCLNVSSVFLIGAASSLVLTLSGVVKDLLLVFGSTLLFRTTVTPLQCLGYGIALVGLMLFKFKA